MVSNRDEDDRRYHGTAETDDTIEPGILPKCSWIRVEKEDEKDVDRHGKRPPGIRLHEPVAQVSNTHSFTSGGTAPFKDESLSLAKSRIFASLKSVVSYHRGHTGAGVGHRSEEEKEVWGGPEFLERPVAQHHKSDGHHGASRSDSLDRDENIDFLRRKCLALLGALHVDGA